MTAEKTWFECCVEERMREHVGEDSTARNEDGAQRGWHPSPPRRTSAGKCALDFASYGGSRVEPKHGRDILVSARASDVVGDAQTIAGQHRAEDP
jgi:hypothetical protein